MCQDHLGEVKKDDPVEYLLPTGIGSTSWVPEGLLAIEVPQNEEIFGGEKNGGRKGIGSAIHRRRAIRAVVPNLFGGITQIKVASMLYYPQYFTS